MSPLNLILWGKPDSMGQALATIYALRLENGGPCWIRTSDQLVKSQSAKSLFSQAIQHFINITCPNQLCAYTADKPLFCIVRAWFMGQNFGGNYARS